MEAFHENGIAVCEQIAQKEKSLSCCNQLGKWEWKQIHVGTNTIYKLANTDGRKYIFKVYNPCSNLDHELELAVIEALAKSKQHPVVIYACNRFRVEEYIESPALDIYHLRTDSVLLSVVKLISAFHNNMELNSEIIPLLTDKRPFIRKIYESWLGDFKRSYEHIKSIIGNGKHKKLIDDLACLFREDFQKLFISLFPKDGELVLSHNDISPANLLYSQCGGSIQELYLIDFEYAALNYRGYDLAVLIEDIITDYNHPDYPTFKMHNELKLSEEQENQIIIHYIRCSSIKPFGSEIKILAKKLKEEVKVCKIIFQLAGVLWGITTHDWNSTYNENDCWRMEYAQQRWEKFTEHMYKNFGIALPLSS